FEEDRPRLIDLGMERTLLLADDRPIISKKARRFRKSLAPIWEDFFRRHEDTWDKISDLRRLQILTPSEHIQSAAATPLDAILIPKRSFKKKGKVVIMIDLNSLGKATRFRFDQVQGMGLDETALKQAMGTTFPVGKYGPTGAMFEVDFTSE